MSSLNIEILMNHSTGVTDSYYRPQVRELLTDYLKAVDSLTIYKKTDKILQKEIEILHQQQENNEYVLKSKLQEKDDAYTILSDQVMKLVEKVENLEKNK